MTSFFKLCFLFSSFGPLYLVFSTKAFFSPCGSDTVSGIFIAAFLASILVFWLLIRMMRRGVGNNYKIVDVKTKDLEVFPYLMAYIPPIAFRDIDRPETYVPTIILYSVISLLYLRLDGPYLNPFFLLFGFRIYEAKLEPSRNVVTVIACRRPVSSNEEIQMTELSAGVYYSE